MSTSPTHASADHAGVVTGTWEELLISPSRLMRMVIAGDARIVGKDERGRHIYRMTQAVLEENRHNALRTGESKVRKSKPE
jgi:hypothetical protein